MEAEIVRAIHRREIDHGEVIVTDLFSRGDVPQVSIAKVRRDGSRGTAGLNSVSDAWYYVLDGKGAVEIEGKEYEVERGDLVFIPRGTKYRTGSNMTFLAVCSPMFDKHQRRTLN